MGQQICHKEIRTDSDNDGFLRVTGDTLFVAKPAPKGNFITVTVGYRMERIQIRTQNLKALEAATTDRLMRQKVRAYSQLGHGPRADQKGRIHISDFRYPEKSHLRNAAGPYIRPAFGTTGSADDATLRMKVCCQRSSAITSGLHPIPEENAPKAHLASECRFRNQ